MKRALGQYNITPTLDFDQETSFSHMLTYKQPEEIVAPTVSFNPDFNPFQSEKKPERQLPFSGSFGDEKREVSKNWGSLYEIVHNPSPEQRQIELPELANGTQNASQKTSERQIFQLHNRFIISQIKSGFMLIDQQAAHERILYERFLQQLENHQGASQQSLFPQTVTLSAVDFELVKELLPDIQALGFQIREFGKNTMVVEGIPADVSTNVSEVEMLEHLIEGFKNNFTLLKLDKRDNLARTLARNAAIKAGTFLSREEMNNLIDQLFACQMPNSSIYGKPVIITFTLEELLQKFEK